MATLRELIRMRDEEGEDIGAIEYSEGSDLNDEFVEMEIVNPENEQHCYVAWVPVDYASVLEAERETAETGRYHNWTSSYMQMLTRNHRTKKAAVKNAKEMKKELLKKYSGIISIDYTLDTELLYDEDDMSYIAYTPNLKFEYAY